MVTVPHNYTSRIKYRCQAPKPKNGITLSKILMQSQESDGGKLIQTGDILITISPTIPFQLCVSLFFRLITTCFIPRRDFPTLPRIVV